jgi:F420H(2)-dependent quinone reductase
MLNSRYLVIEFTGRKTGRIFRTPVAYVADGERVLLSTDSPWWRNFITPAPVRLWPRGRLWQGTATATRASRRRRCGSWSTRSRPTPSRLTWPAIGRAP